MKKFILSLLLVACTSLGHAALTNLPGGLGVGTESAGTYVALTGVTLSYVDVPLASVRQFDCKTIVSDQVITTALYVGTATTMSNTTAVCVPAQISTVGPSVQFYVPQNYLSGGYMELLVHSSAAVPNLVTSTVAVGIQTPGSADSLAQVWGSAMVWPTSVSYTVRAVSHTAAASYKPGDLVTAKFTVAGADAIKEILGIRFIYRPYGVMR